MHLFQLFSRNPVDRLGMSTCPYGSIKGHSFFAEIDWDKLERKQVPPPLIPKLVSVPNNVPTYYYTYITAEIP